MGYFLLYEARLPQLIEARDKWLKPGGLMFPDRAKMFVSLVQDPDHKRKHYDYFDDVYGFDFSSLKEAAKADPVIQECDETALISSSTCILNLDLLRCSVSTCYEFSAKFKLRTLELGAAGPTTETLVEWDLGINIWTQDKERLIKFVVLNTLGPRDAMAEDGPTFTKEESRDRSNRGIECNGVAEVATDVSVHRRQVRRKLPISFSGGPLEDAPLAAPAVSEPPQKRRKQQTPKASEEVGISPTWAFPLLVALGIAWPAYAAKGSLDACSEEVVPWTQVQQELLMPQGVSQERIKALSVLALSGGLDPMDCDCWYGWISLRFFIPQVLPQEELAHVMEQQIFHTELVAWLASPWMEMLDSPWKPLEALAQSAKMFQRPELNQASAFEIISHL
eukprot:symbB.v1.2.010354.t1/scaffold677.1/size173266/2